MKKNPIKQPSFYDELDKSPQTGLWFSANDAAGDELSLEVCKVDDSFIALESYDQQDDSMKCILLNEEMARALSKALWEWAEFQRKSK